MRPTLSEAQRGPSRSPTTHPHTRLQLCVDSTLSRSARPARVPLRAGESHGNGQCLVWALVLNQHKVPWRGRRRGRRGNGRLPGTLWRRCTRCVRRARRGTSGSRRRGESPLALAAAARGARARSGPGSAAISSRISSAFRREVGSAITMAAASRTAAGVASIGFEHLGDPELLRSSGVEQLIGSHRQSVRQRAYRASRPGVRDHGSQ